MRIYELLGVKLFRKLVFWLEKLIHRKDKGLNINYHIPRKEISAMDAFIKYLFYNGSIHARNLLFFLVYVLAKLLLGWSFRMYDIVICLLAVKDLYCVMLQRYNYLRISLYKTRLAKHKQLRQKRNAEKISEGFSASYDFSHAKQDLELIKRLKHSIQNRECIVLSEEDAETLNRLLASSQEHEEC